MIGSSFMVIVSLALRFHPSRDSRISTADCGGSRPCLMSTRNLRTFLLLVVLAFLVTCVLVGTPSQPTQLSARRHFSSGLTPFAMAGPPTCSSQDHQLRVRQVRRREALQVSQKGTDRTYVEFMSPREKGRHLLMLGDDMWIYLPDTSRPIRITPLERLSGDASNGDVARTNYAVDYSAVYLRTEKQGSEQCFVLELKAKRKGCDLSAHPLLVARSRMLAPSAPSSF